MPTYSLTLKENLPFATKLTWNQLDDNFLYLEGLSGNINGDPTEVAFFGPSGGLTSSPNFIIATNSNNFTVGYSSNLINVDGGVGNSIIGGYNNTLGNNGIPNYASNTSTILGSYRSGITRGQFSSIIGTDHGYNYNGVSSVIIGSRQSQMISSCRSVIMGGVNNYNSYSESTIISGEYNRSEYGLASSIIGGCNNSIYNSRQSGILGGNNNQIFGSYNTQIIGSQESSVAGLTNSIILGGHCIRFNDSAYGRYSNTVLTPAFKSKIGTSLIIDSKINGTPYIALGDLTPTNNNTQWILQDELARITNQVGVFNEVGEWIVQDVAGNQMINANVFKGGVQLGDISSALHSTVFNVNDSGIQIESIIGTYGVAGNWTVEDKSGHIVLNLDIENGLFKIGDINGASHSTYININDASSQIINYVGHFNSTGSWIVQDNFGHQVIRADMSSGILTMGDISGASHSTTVQIYDPSQTIYNTVGIWNSGGSFVVQDTTAHSMLNASFTTGTIAMGDVQGVSHSTIFQVNDPSKAINSQAGTQSFNINGVGQSISMTTNQFTINGHNAVSGTFSAYPGGAHIITVTNGIITNIT